MFDHSHCQNIHSQSQNCRFQNFLAFGEKYVHKVPKCAQQGGGGVKSLFGECPIIHSFSFRGAPLTYTEADARSKFGPFLLLCLLALRSALRPWRLFCCRGHSFVSHFHVCMHCPLLECIARCVALRAQTQCFCFYLHLTQNYDSYCSSRHRPAVAVGFCQFPIPSASCYTAVQTYNNIIRASKDPIGQTKDHSAGRGTGHIQIFK